MEYEDMDALELMAWDLEAAQNKRYNEATHLSARQFWKNVTEQAVRQTIKTLRAGSSTYCRENYEFNYNL